MTAAILNIIAPVFVVILAGYVAVRFRFFPKDGVKFLMQYAQNFAVPLLLFGAVSQVDFAEHFRLDIILSYFLPMLLIFATGFGIARRAGRDAPTSTVLGFNAFFANSVLLGLPIAERAYGTENMWVNFVIISVHSPVAYFCGSFSMEFAKAGKADIHQTLRRAFRELGRNPLIIGILAGLIANALNVSLPGFLGDAINMQARAAIPVALFGLGGVLTGFKIKGAVAPILSTAFLRLFLHTALVLAFGHFLFGLSGQTLLSIALIATMPTGTNGFIFASLYQREEELSASIVFLTTILASLTIPLWLMLFAQL